MPVPQREIRRIKKEEAVALLGECTNIRDYFLLYLLFETGMRIGEALSLWLEDFDLDGLKVSVTDRGELENLAEIKTVHSARKLDCTQDLADLFMGYVCEVHNCDVSTNHVFLKLGEGMRESRWIIQMWTISSGRSVKRPVFRSPRMYSAILR